LVIGSLRLFLSGNGRRRFAAGNVLDCFGQGELMRQPRQQQEQARLWRGPKRDDIGFGERRSALGDQMIRPAQFGVGSAFGERADILKPPKRGTESRVGLLQLATVKLGRVRYPGPFECALVAIEL
jgi:hypothetical protein